MTLRRRGPQAAIPTPRIATNKDSPARENHQPVRFAALSTIANFSSMTMIRFSLYSLIRPGPDYARDMKIDPVASLVVEGEANSQYFRVDFYRRVRFCSRIPARRRAVTNTLIVRSIVILALVS